MEAVGLALAVLPLLVNQLDNYVRGLQTVKGFRARRYRQQLDEYFSNIGTQHALFLNTLERTLDGVFEYQDGMDDLINNPSGEAWKKPELIQKMEKKLERNYVPFKKTMEELSGLLGDLNRRLGFEDMSSAEVFWKNASTLEREVRKFRDIFSKTIYADLLDRISAANTILHNLVKQSEYRNQPHRRRLYSLPLSRYRLSRRSARSLHNTIIRGKCWKCPCKSLHKIHFFLCHGDIKPFNPSTDTPGNPRFNIILTSAANSGPISSCNTAYKLEAESEIIKSSIGLHHLCNSDHTSVKSLTRSLNSHSKRSVYFSLPVTTRGPSPTPSLQLPEIADICGTLSALGPGKGNKSVLGSLSDDSHRHNIIYLHSLSLGLRPQSLEDLITASAQFLNGQTDDGFIFSQLDRLRLAVNLSCSVFQYHGSWLAHHWRPRDIMFDPQDAANLGDPFLSCDLGDDLSDLTRTEIQSTSTLIRNQVLFPLGLALVELSLCQNLQSLRENDDEDINEAHANLKTATRLLPKVEERSGPEYADVVDRCLSWHDRRSTSLESEKVQEEVFRLIIYPLVENLRSFEDAYTMY
ncbi:hypothetical protein P170DRAFT_404644 [Aspergillus steynii IBT 23096]|uniref:DUF7580 domain-containing protein n=1 Tax=Aspergillus steynii IBT 23096 TaxID=1392250 RepID=A0A2I2GAR6_9EURO|nr:uncharacterized protein P170DRAFT_404644 [Aspergillus steynii IBT 23096]PLB49971.1 hypothetical protein P170DRAFT_404644 [Aspergillus steynii IBT 23096]